MKLQDLHEARKLTKLGSIPVVPVKGRSGDIKYPSSGMIGSEGAQGYAYNHPTDKGRVIKYTNIQFPYQEDPYVMFVDICLHHQDNPFFPKLGNPKLYDFDGSVSRDDGRDENSRHGTMIMTMEKLKQAEYDHHWRRAMLSCGPNFEWFMKHYVEHKRPNGMSFPNKQFIPRDSNNQPTISKDDVMDMLSDSMTFDHIAESGEMEFAFNNKAFLEAYRLLAVLFKKFGTDFHRGNIMRRVDNHAVIIDPMFLGD